MLSRRRSISKNLVIALFMLSHRRWTGESSSLCSSG